MVSIGLPKRNEPLPSAAYPFRGILHFAHHPRSLGGPILSSAIKASVVSLLTVVPLVRYGYGPQTRFISRLYMACRPQTPIWLVALGSLITGSFLCLAESFIVMDQINYFIVGSMQDRFFDSVMEEREGNPVESLKIAEKPKEEQAFTRRHRYLSPLNIMFMTSQKDESWGLIFLSPAVFIATLPLYIVPIVGPAMFLSIQAVFKGGETHKRYFTLYKWTDTQRERRIENACWQYYRFGLVATLLEMVPFAGFVFSYTNQIGAAMWAMDLHDKDLIEPKSL